MAALIGSSTLVGKTVECIIGLSPLFLHLCILVSPTGEVWHLVPQLLELCAICGRIHSVKAHNDGVLGVICIVVWTKGIGAEAVFSIETLCDEVTLAHLERGIVSMKTQGLFQQRTEEAFTDLFPAPFRGDGQNGDMCFSKKHRLPAETYNAVGDFRNKVAGGPISQFRLKNRARPWG